MSKAAEARIRDELLQGLYADTLRGTLACANAGISVRDAAFAAGMAACLRPGDLLLLPRGHASGCLRALRGLAPRAATRLGTERELTAGVLTLPAEEAAGVSLAMGAGAAARTARGGALVLVLLPSGLGADSAVSRATGFPSRWRQAGEYAALHALPLLLAGVGPRVGSSLGRIEDAHLRPAARFPSIPVDRADALAVYRVTHECAQRARGGLGPSHIAGVGFRIRGEAEAADGLSRLETMLRRRSLFSKAARRHLEQQILREFEN